MSGELWQAWNQDRRPESLRPLLDAHTPLINHELARWSGSGLPPIVLKAEARRLARNAYETYDPSKGAEVSTHLVNHLRGLGTFVVQHRDPVRMPLDQARLADKVYRSKQELELQLGREATVQEIQQHAGVGTTSLGNLSRQQARLYSQNEAAGFDQPARQDLTNQELVTDFLYHDLTPRQQLVFDHFTGRNGREALGTQAIAERLNLTPGRVSAIRNQIRSKAERYSAAVLNLMEA